MSSYHRDFAGNLHCRHGRILYGTGCVTCDREDAASPMTETEVLRTVDRAERRWRPDSIDELLMRQGMFPAGSFYEAERGRYWQGTATRQPVEIITDPADTRGMNARRVGP